MPNQGTKVRSRNGFEGGGDLATGKGRMLGTVYSKLVLEKKTSLKFIYQRSPEGKLGFFNQLER